MERERLEYELRYGLPVFRRELRITNSLEDCVKESLRDERTHILATCMAAYPYTPTKELAEEFKIKPKIINAIANYYGIHKMKSMRSTINSENARHVKTRASKFVGKIVEKVARNGRVVATFVSTAAAANAMGVSRIRISERCNGHIKSRLDGYTYRYKK